MIPEVWYLEVLVLQIYRQKSKKIRNLLIFPFIFLSFFISLAFIVRHKAIHFENFKFSTRRQKDWENQIFSNIFLENKNVIPILLHEYSLHDRRQLPWIYSISTKINVAISLGVTNNFMNILFLESRECESISIFK